MVSLVSAGTPGIGFTAVDAEELGKGLHSTEITLFVRSYCKLKYHALSTRARVWGENTENDKHLGNVTGTNPNSQQGLNYTSSKSLLSKAPFSTSLPGRQQQSKKGVKKAL